MEISRCEDMSEKEKKSRLRDELTEWRKNLSCSERQNMNSMVKLRSLSLPFFDECDDIMCFASFGSELDTWELIRAAAAAGKRVYLPKTDTNANELIPLRVEYRDGKFTNLRPGTYGIYEPVESEVATNLDLIYVPGLAFDYSGYRVGYGGGYYDRFLPGWDAITVGLCYYQQLVKSVPKSSHDIPVDLIVTEYAIINTKQWRIGSQRD